MKLKQLIIGFFSSVFAFTACQAQREFPSVGADEFEKLITKPEVVCLDVRTQQEYLEGHIACALHIDVKNPQFSQRAQAALDKDKTIAVYCRSGNRSKKACDILTSQGYKVVELATGILGWQEANKATTREEVDVFTTAKGSPVELHCIKHGSLAIRMADKWIYIDPVADKIPPATDYSQRPKADYIIVTHEHPDHLDTKAIEQLLTPKTMIIANPRSAEILGGKVESLENYESKLIDKKWTIDAVPAYNSSPEKQQYHPKGRDNGYVLTIEGLRIYVAGDTEDIAEMENIKDIDVAFLPCNLPFTMTPQQCVKAALIIKPRVLFPYHYGQTEIEQVQNMLDGSGIDVRIRQYQ